MKTRTLVIISVIGMLIILALTYKVKPFTDSPVNHIEELKQIPEVGLFYQKYGQYDVTVFPDGAYSYQIGFQATNEEGQWIMLKVNYRFGFPSNIFVHCTPGEIQTQYTVRENVSDYLENDNCFI